MKENKRRGSLMALLLSTAALLLFIGLYFFVHFNPFFFTQATITHYKNWFPSFYHPVYSVVHSGLFSLFFLKTAILLSSLALLYSAWPFVVAMNKTQWLLTGTSLLFSLLVAEWYMQHTGRFDCYAERIGAGNYQSPFEAEVQGWLNVLPPYYEVKQVEKEFTVEWKANKDGLNETDPEQFVSGKRILILGDSYTNGVGAPNDSSYPRILQHLIQQSGAEPAQVINAGISGSDIVFEYRLLIERLFKYKPDVVLVTINASDVTDVYARGGFERFQPNGKLQFRKGPWYEPLYAHSHLVRAVVHNVLKQDYFFRSPEEVAVTNREVLKQMQQAVDSFLQYTAANNMAIGFVFQPLPHEILSGYDTTIHQLMRYTESRSPAAVCNVVQCFRDVKVDSSNYKQLYWPIDGHFTATGYNMLANCVFNFLSTKQYLQPHNGTQP